MEIGEGPRVHEVEACRVIGVAFAREADDHVGADGGVREMLPNEFDAASVMFGAIPAVHGRENAVGGGLQWHVEVRSEARVGSEEFDEIPGDVEGLDGTDAETFDGGFAEHTREKVEKFYAWREIASVGAEIDAAEDDFAKAGVRKALNFGKHGLRRQAAGFSADNWNDAERTAGVAAILNFESRPGVIPFPAENRGDEHVGELEDFAGKNGGRKDGEVFLSESSGLSKLYPYRAIRGQNGMEEGGYLRFVRVADNERNTGEGGEFFGSTLSVTAGDDDARGGTGGVEFADGVASLGIRRGSDGAGVENDDIGLGGAGGKREAAFEKLALDSGAVGLGGAAAKLFDKEGVHRRVSGLIHLITRQASSTEAADAPDFARVASNEYNLTSR